LFLLAVVLMREEILLVVDVVDPMIGAPRHSPAVLVRAPDSAPAGVTPLRLRAITLRRINLAPRSSLATIGMTN